MRTIRWARPIVLPALAISFVVVASSGCATKGFVREEIQKANDYTDAQVGPVRERADEAYARATLAERLAAGELEYEVVSTHQVQFEFDDWRLSDGARMTLDDLARRLGEVPRYVVEIRGYADARGTDRYNFRLGRERAESVHRYLMTQHAVPAGRVAIVSFGEENPIADNSSSEGRAQNRRAVVRLLQAKPQGEPMASDL